MNFFNFGVLTIVAVIAIGSSLFAAAKNDDFVLTIDLPVEGGLGEAPFYIAVEKDFDAKAGLKYKASNRHDRRHQQFAGDPARRLAVKILLALTAPR